MAQSYFVLQFVLRTQFYDNLNNSAIINYKAYEEMIGFLEAIDVYREYYQDTDTKIGRKELLKETVYTEWEMLYLAQKESRIHDPAECTLLSKNNKNEILDLLNGNLCSRQNYIENMQNNSQCTVIANKTATLVFFIYQKLLK